MKSSDCLDQARTSKRRDTLAKMKVQVKESITKDSYDVANFYHSTGFAQWIVKQHRFEQLTLFVIALNAIWIWVDTDLNPGTVLISSPPLFQLVEHLFCLYFSYEWTMRFLAFRLKRDCLRDFWFVFDGLLVGSMVFETWIMSTVFLVTDSVGGGGVLDASILRLARLLRLARMGRVARLLRALPDLLILIKGMVYALRSVCFALGLLLMILYVFGIAFTQLCEGTALEPEFPTVLRSMHTLFVYGALMDEVSSLIGTIEAISIPILILFYVFILLAALTLMNMLIGVICEMVLKVGEEERQQAMQSFVIDKITELIMTGADEDDNCHISKREFMTMLENKRAVSILHEVGVDVVALVDFTDTIFEHMPGEEWRGEKQLSIAEFSNVLLELRGDRSAKVRDIMELRKCMNACFKRLEEKLFNVEFVGLNQIGTTPKGSETPVALAASETQSHKSIWAASVWESPITMDSKEMKSPSLSFLKEQINMSLRALQATHESELARLHDENLKLLDRLRDVSSAAGQSIGAVLQVVASVPSPVTETRAASTRQLNLAAQPWVEVVHNGMDGIPAEPQKVKTPRQQQTLRQQHTQAGEAWRRSRQHAALDCAC